MGPKRVRGKNPNKYSSYLISKRRGKEDSGKGYSTSAANSNQQSCMARGIGLLGWNSVLRSQAAAMCRLDAAS